MDGRGVIETSLKRNWVPYTNEVNLRMQNKLQFTAVKIQPYFWDRITAVKFHAAKHISLLNITLVIFPCSTFLKISLQ